MSGWLQDLPIGWMALVVFLATFLVTAGIYRVVMALAVGERVSTFKGVSPALLSPLGIIFGLLVGFLAVQVWGDTDRARTAVGREASSLRAVVLLAAAFGGDTEMRFRALVQQHIEEAVKTEWPAMARQDATLTVIPASLAGALQLALGLKPEGAGQMAAQREIVASLQSALDARRQRIIVSESTLDWVKWTGLLLQAVVILFAIAISHSDNRATAAVALGVFATAVALAILLIASHNRPFSGSVGVGPEVLLQVMPENPAPRPVE